MNITYVMHCNKCDEETLHIYKPSSEHTSINEEDIIYDVTCNECYETHQTT